MHGQQMPDPRNASVPRESGEAGAVTKSPAESGGFMQDPIATPRAAHLSLHRTARPSEVAAESIARSRRRPTTSLCPTKMLRSATRQKVVWGRRPRGGRWRWSHVTFLRAGHVTFGSRSRTAAQVSAQHWTRIKSAQSQRLCVLGPAFVGEAGVASFGTVQQTNTIGQRVRPLLDANHRWLPLSPGTPWPIVRTTPVLSQLGRWCRPKTSPEISGVYEA